MVSGTLEVFNYVKIETEGGRIHTLSEIVKHLGFNAYRVKAILEKGVKLGVIEKRRQDPAEPYYYAWHTWSSNYALKSLVRENGLWKVNITEEDSLKLITRLTHIIKRLAEDRMEW